MHFSKFVCSLFFFVGVASTMAAPEVLVSGKCQTVLGNGVAKVTYDPFTLSSKEKNSELLSLDLSADRMSSVLVSLNQTGKRCKDVGCEDYIGSVYMLSVVRLFDETQAKLQLGKDRLVRGKTATTAKATLFNDGAVETEFVKENELISSDELSMPLELNYRVRRGGLFGKQTIKVSCQFELI